MSTNFYEYEYALVDADSLKSKGYKIGLNIDLWYLNVTVPNENVDGNTDIYIDFSDTKCEFGTGRQRGFT